LIETTTQPSRAPSFSVAVRDLTLVPKPEKKAPPPVQSDKNDDLSISAIPLELLSPVSPSLRLSVKDRDMPPEIASDGEGESGEAQYLHYEEKAVVPETPVPPSPRGKQAGKPRIAIIIDDVGIRATDTERLASLPTSVTFSFLPYAPRLQEQADRARETGRELMLHLPMQPLGRDNPGPDALMTNLSPEANMANLEKALDSFKGFDGVNNHMGSRFTSDTAAMTPVLKAIAAHGYFFVDSRTSSQSVGGKVAASLGIRYATRDVFLDDDESEASIQTQLAKTEKVARAKGRAIAIGHPHAETIRLLEDWIKKSEADGIEFVPVRELMK
jgi:polysaccharide deacetylase 2 family uncharacterized protein YibQ